MSKSDTDGCPSGVVVGRLALLLAAAAALAAGLCLSQRRDRASSASAERYVCPMHPQVVSAVRGDCPICNMALEPMRAGSDAEPIVAKHKGIAQVERQAVAQVVRAPAWVGRDGVLTAVVHEDALEGFRPGDEGLFFRNAEPAQAIPVRLTSEPAAPWDPATVRVRFAAQEVSLAAGNTGWLQLDGKRHRVLVVPESAVLHSGEGAYVLAAVPGASTFSRRAIRVGTILDSGYVAERAEERLGGIVVLAGLREGDRVVIADTFILDAERRLRASQGRPEEIVE